MRVKLNEDKTKELEIVVCCTELPLNTVCAINHCDTDRRDRTRALGAWLSVWLPIGRCSKLAPGNVSGMLLLTFLDVVVFETPGT